MDKLKELLDIPQDAVIDEIQRRFNILSNMLLGEYEILKGDTHYNILEIEFYFYNDNHKDIPTYERKTESGKWFTHLSGVDISFKSDREKKYYGGILIRSIIDTKDERIINGPLCSMIELFNNIDIQGEFDNIPIIKRRESIDNNTIIKSITRYNIKDSFKYCYYNASPTIKWKSGYSAMPSKRE